MEPSVSLTKWGGMKYELWTVKWRKVSKKEERKKVKEAEKVGRSVDWVSW